MFRIWLGTLFLWLPFVTLAVVVGVFLRRRLWVQLPFFSLYLVSALLAGAVRQMSTSLGEWPYFYTYWISDLAGSVVVFLAMYEVFFRRLFPRFHRTHVYRRVFPILAMVVLLLTIFSALVAHDKGAAFLMASRAFDIARTVVLMFFIALMMFMGRQWSRYDLGITLGFAIHAAVALASAAARTRVHYQATIFDTIEVIAYNVSCFIWLITFWKPEKRTQFLSPDQVDPEMLHQARAVESLLKKWITASKSKR